MKAAITSLTGVENEHFPTIRDWIRHFLQDESEVSHQICIEFNQSNIGYTYSCSISLLLKRMIGTRW